MCISLLINLNDIVVPDCHFPSGTFFYFSPRFLSFTHPRLSASTRSNDPNAVT